MQTRKADIRSEILKAARNKFLRKSYLKTSMREIAEEAHVSTANIYNYFSGKDDIFKAVVAPLMERFEYMLERNHGDSSPDAMEMFSSDYLHRAVEDYMELMEKYRPLMQILLFSSRGSSLENFRKDYTSRATAYVKEWFRDNKIRHPEINADVSDFSISLHTIWMFSLMEEIIVNKIGPEQIRQIINEYICLEIHGWKSIMNIH